MITVVIYGAFFADEDIKELVDPAMVAKALLSDEEILSYNILEENLPAYFEIETDDYNEVDVYYVGRQWDSIKDNETGKEFKDSVKKELEKLFKKEIFCRTIAVVQDDD